MFNVAIDGPAGAGKSTVARRVAAEMGIIYVDTGAIYRTVAVNALRNKIDVLDEKAVTESLKDIDIKLGFVGDEQHVFLNGEDVSKEIRLPEVSMATSNIAKIPSVRAFLLELQRSIARESDCLMDGRDIGTVVLPGADVKIFLTASAEVRAKRRYDELIEKGTPVEFDALLEEIKQRDYNDSHREIAPLRPAEDSITVDTSDMPIDEVVETIIKICKSK